VAAKQPKEKKKKKSSLQLRFSPISAGYNGFLISLDRRKRRRRRR
jgi:hypothetical protein